MHKACPFCGGNPVYRTELEKMFEEDSTAFEECKIGFISCTRCFCRTQGLYVDGPNSEYTEFATEDDVWADWDMRKGE